MGDALGGGEVEGTVLGVQIDVDDADGVGDELDCTR